MPISVISVWGNLLSLITVCLTTLNMLLAIFETKIFNFFLCIRLGAILVLCIGVQSLWLIS
jgi:hypothetical protein